jgi:predicted nuclease with TOPRIM domain
LEEEKELLRTVQEEKQSFRDMLTDLNAQIDEIKNQVANFEFQKFKLNNQFAKEDETNAQMDVDRQNQWLEDATAYAEEVKAEQDALREENGSVSAENQAEFDRLNGVIQEANRDRDDLAGEVQALRDSF